MRVAQGSDAIAKQRLKLLKRTGDRQAGADRALTAIGGITLHRREVGKCLILAQRLQVRVHPLKIVWDYPSPEAKRSFVSQIQR